MAVESGRESSGRHSVETCRSRYLRPGTVWEPRESGTSAVEGRYQATASEDVTENTSFRVLVICKVHSQVV
jgi:hypothetical protein